MKQPQNCIINYLALLVFLTNLMSCTCPSDIKLGEIRMINPSFFPYKGNEELTFVSSRGKIMKLKNTAQPQPNRLFIETLCKKAFSIQWSYYEGVHAYDLVYRSEIHNFSLQCSFKTLVSNNSSSSDTLFYDYLGVNNLELVVSDRGNKNDEFIRNRLIQNRTVADTVINGIRYKNVYCRKSEPSIYYTTTQGIIAFYYDNEWWYLR